MKNQKQHNLLLIKYILFIGIILGLSFDGFSQFSINRDSLFRICENEIINYDATMKKNNRKKLLGNLASTVILGETYQAVEKEDWTSVFFNIKNNLVEFANQYDYYDKIISKNKYVSDRIELDTNIAQVIVANYLMLQEMEKTLTTEQLKTKDNKVLLCAMSAENEIIFSELKEFKVRFGKIYGEFEQNEYKERQAQQEAQQETRRIQQEAQRIENEKKRNELIAAEQKKKEEREKEDLEHKEWLKNANYSFKIDITYKEQKKECRFCYTECKTIIPNYSKPDFSKYSTYERKHLEYEYTKIRGVLFVIAQSKAQSDCSNYDLGKCKESRSGEHALKEIGEVKKTTETKNWNIRPNN